MNWNSNLRRLLAGFAAAISLVGCLPHKSRFFDGPIWSDSDQAILYVDVEGTSYPMSIHHDFDVEKNRIMVTHTQNPADSVLLFEEEDYVSIHPLYFSEQHQVFIYYSTEYSSHIKLRIFDLASRTIEVSLLSFDHPVTASLSPDGEWIALYQKTYTEAQNERLMSMMIVPVENSQEGRLILSAIPASSDGVPRYHWQGNNEVWVSSGSGYVVFHTDTESVTEEAQGCIEPSNYSSDINSQGLQVKAPFRKQELIFKQRSPVLFCH